MTTRLLKIRRVVQMSTFAIVTCAAAATSRAQTARPSVDLSLVPASSLRAESPTVMTDLMKDVDAVHSKFVALAKAVPVAKYPARPGVGVRSVSEVFLHVAGDNYMMPALAGTAIPASVKLDMKNFKSFDAFEKQTMTTAQIVEALDASFAHLKAAMAKTTAADLTVVVDMFGQKSSKQALWIGTTTHLHEHLGQSIAYARQNGIVPPWSK